MEEVRGTGYPAPHTPTQRDDKSLLIAGNSRVLPGEGHRPQRLPRAVAIQGDGLGGGCWAGCHIGGTLE